MNIKEAVEQIEGAIQAYLAKDDHGLYCIPFRMQRPIIMLGPPGVGKTAVVEQIAERMDINFVSYSITHHTRQSALGLPFIAKEEFDGREYSVSEYTMSEFIAAVHRARQESGVSEGILFLDEVNCVSETLAPAMLQFLQYKTFGMHHLPEGWVIVTAGNPPEYNRAAREFDPAMLDRLLKIEVEPDVQVWQEYAVAHGVHPAITTYLDARPSNFYNVRASAHGSKIVTSRGWEDLSRMIQAYERLGRVPPESMPGRYLQDSKIAEEFSVYYQLFRKYQDDYKILDILNGNYGLELINRASSAQFDERVALIGMLQDAVRERVHSAIELAQALKAANTDLKNVKDALDCSEDPAACLEEQIVVIAESKGVGKRAKDLVGDKDVIKSERMRILFEIRRQIAVTVSGTKKPSAIARGVLSSEKKRLALACDTAQKSIDNSFDFLDESFGEDSQESLMFITKLSSDVVVVRFIVDFGSERYMKHNKSLLFTERGLNLLAEIEKMEV